jgi:hypothetical protein
MEILIIVWGHEGKIFRRAKEKINIVEVLGLLV